LLIGSSYDGLKGPENDVIAISELLEKKGFQQTNIFKVEGPTATRRNILSAWKDFIAETQADDVVLIYYSGHGALVEPEDGSTQGRHKFIVPVDYRQDDPASFCGILQEEISFLLRESTDKTANVTAIMDCCHAGRMARNHLNGRNAVPRFLNPIRHADVDAQVRTFLAEHSSTIKVDQDRDPRTFKDNELLVSIAAAAENETAWEFADAEGKTHGVLTHALIRALDGFEGDGPCSWSMLMLHVADLVRENNGLQHPQVDGRSRRLLFSLDETTGPDSFAVATDDEDPDLIHVRAGRAMEIAVGDALSIMPHGWSATGHEQETILATVTRIESFSAEARLAVPTATSGQKFTTGIATVRQRALRTTPVHVPEAIPSLANAVRASRYLRVANTTEANSSCLCTFVCGKTANGLTQVVLRTATGVEIVERTFGGVQDHVAAAALVQAAEQLAKSQHLLYLRPSDLEEQLFHDLRIEMGIVAQGTKHHTVDGNGLGVVCSGERACLWLTNKGTKTIWVNIFDVNVAGKISHIGGDSSGIEVAPGTEYVYGKGRGGDLQGEEFTWPKNIKALEAIEETLVFVLTEKSTDLRCLVSRDAIPRGNTASTLRKLLSQIATGGTRDFGESSTARDVMAFDTFQLTLMLTPHLISAAEVRETTDSGVVARVSQRQHSMHAHPELTL
jgi:hypothetical protein